MNRIESAAKRQTVRDTIRPVAALAEGLSPIACTPAFAGFGAGYLVAMAFGPSEETEAKVRAAVHDATAMSGAELINARRRAITA